jgi:rhodanese-related sulfurtransferase
MKKMLIFPVCVVFVIAGLSFNSYAGCDVCEGPSHTHSHKGGKTMTYSSLYQEAEVKDGVKEITYDQFQKIRKSGEDYILVDVLGADSYDKGHIEGAINLPVYGISEESTAKVFSKDANIIVYCGSFRCSASTNAAKKLGELGYKVLDYKGGLKEWQEKGNTLVK